MTNRDLPLEVLRCCVVHFLTSVTVPEAEAWEIGRPGRDSIQALKAFSLVHPVLVKLCQEFLFFWITIRNHDQLRRLYDLLLEPQSSRLSSHIHQISVVYESPCKHLGDVLHKLATMGLTSLQELEFVSLGPSSNFPFHKSLPLAISRLPPIHSLTLCGFRFTHLAEFRRFIGAFQALSKIDLVDVTWGIDKLGELRGIFGNKNKGLLEIDASWNTPPALITSLWVEGLSCKHPPSRVIVTQPETNPRLTRSLALTLTELLGMFSSVWWQCLWEYHAQDCTCKLNLFDRLSSVLSYRVALRAARSVR